MTIHPCFNRPNVQQAIDNEQIDAVLVSQRLDAAYVAIVCSGLPDQDDAGAFVRLHRIIQRLPDALKGVPSKVHLKRVCRGLAVYARAIIQPVLKLTLNFCAEYLLIIAFAVEMLCCKYRRDQ